MHEVLVNRLGGLSLPRKSVVRLSDRPDMTLDVYCGCKQQCNNNNNIICVIQNRVWPITSSHMVGFEKNLAQMIIMNKNHIPRSKVKVTVHT